MNEIDEAGSTLVAELEFGIDENYLDIADHARERDQTIGDPNIIDNVLIPIWTIIRRRPLQDSMTNSNSKSGNGQGPAG